MGDAVMGDAAMGNAAMGNAPGGDNKSLSQKHNGGVDSFASYR